MAQKTCNVCGYDGMEKIDQVGQDGHRIDVYICPMCNVLQGVSASNDEKLISTQKKGA